MLVERFDATDKTHAIDQENCYMSRPGTRGAKESVLPLQGLFSHLGHPSGRYVLRGAWRPGRHCFHLSPTNMRLRTRRTNARKFGARQIYSALDSASTWASTNGADKRIRLASHRPPTSFVRAFYAQHLEVVRVTVHCVLVVCWQGCRRASRSRCICINARHR